MNVYVVGNRHYPAGSYPTYFKIHGVFSTRELAERYLSLCDALGETDIVEIEVDKLKDAKLVMTYEIAHLDDDQVKRFPASLKIWQGEAPINIDELRLSWSGDVYAESCLSYEHAEQAAKERIQEVRLKSQQKPPKVYGWKVAYTVEFGNGSSLIGETQIVRAPTHQEARRTFFGTVPADKFTNAKSVTITDLTLLKEGS